MKYNIVANDGTRESVTAFHKGREFVALKTHPRFAAICEALENHDLSGEEHIIGLFELGEVLSEKFGRLSERVLVVNGKVLFDGEPIDNALTKAILGFYEQGHDDFLPLVFFFENVEQNPNEHSRQQLFGWLSKNNFSLDEKGNIVAYKGVQRNGRGKDDADFLSVHSGKALVNGRWVTGKIPTSPGTIVEMPRSEVQHDPRQGCHTGLHAGDWSYANSFSEVTLRVLINPRDVVSVPSDSNERKMRVCRYRVLGVAQSRDESILLSLNADELRTRYLPTKKEPVNVAKRASTKLTAPPTTAPVDAPAPATKAVKKASTIMLAPGKQTSKKVVTPVKAVAVKKAPAKKAVAVSKTAPVKKQAPVVKAAPTPKFYEDFMKADFINRPRAELVWLARQWEVKPAGSKSLDYVTALAKAATARRRKDLKPRDKVKVGTAPAK